MKRKRTRGPTRTMLLLRKMRKKCLQEAMTEMMMRLDPTRSQCSLHSHQQHCSKQQQQMEEEEQGQTQIQVKLYSSLLQADVEEKERAL